MAFRHRPPAVPGSGFPASSSSSARSWLSGTILQQCPELAFRHRPPAVPGAGFPAPSSSSARSWLQTLTRVWHSVAEGTTASGCCHRAAPSALQAGPWRTAEDHGGPWRIMEDHDHGGPWRTMEDHKGPWRITEDHGGSWRITEDH